MHVNPDLLALLALGEPVGTAEDQRHLAGCPACRDELASLEHVVGVGRTTSAQDVLLAPPPQVWQRISAELQLGASQAAPPSRLRSEPPPPPLPPVRPLGAAAATPAPAAAPRSLRAASLALAAVLALVVGIGLGANLDRLLPGQTEVTAVQLNALPPWSGSSGRAVVEEDRDGNRWLVVEIDSPTAATGPREVWLTNTQADPMYPIGFLRDNTGRFPLAPNVDVREVPLVDISQEPADDHDPGHSGDSMLRGKLPV